MKNLIIGLIILAIGVFAYWTIAPLFIEKEVNDELPAELLSPPTPTVPTDTATGQPIIIETQADTQTNTSAASELPAPEPVALFPIEDTPGHPATGNIRVVRGGGEQIVRFEDYEGTNGPDLFVYLAKDLDAEEFVNLGPARGNKGNINYSVPMDVDLDDYQYVMTWCRAFGVLFDYAEIQ